MDTVAAFIFDISSLFTQPSNLGSVMAALKPMVLLMKRFVSSHQPWLQTCPELLQLRKGINNAFFSIFAHFFHLERCNVGNPGLPEIFLV